MNRLGMRMLWVAVCCIAFAGCSGANSGSMPSPGQAAGASFAQRPQPLPAGASYKILYTFGGSPDGANSFAGLADVKGVLYGTTVGGGSGNGSVFKITTSGDESVLHSFGGTPNDGSGPFATVTDVAGAFYGTTAEGGPAGLGTVFKITRAGRESVLHDFGAASDGSSPYGNLLDVKGTLYGTTAIGGNAACYGLGCGTIFSITTTGTERVVHTFAGEPSDGSFPDAGLIEVDGTLYGTTRLGGANKLGTVFKITPSGKETVLYSFQGGNDGYYPQSNLVEVKGTLYGTTVGGGAGSAGTVFAITTSGKENVLYSFRGGSDGANPYAGVVDLKGALYGTTYEGGASGFGTVFKLTLTGTESVLHSFAGYPNDGDYPQAAPANVGGTLYGTTDYGSTGCVYQMGLSGCGIIYALTP
jgi:uncharacterized repeat protein (TIGR03803 family)